MMAQSESVPEAKRLRSCEPDLLVLVGSGDETKEYRYHSPIMASHSTYIDAMLATPMKESQSLMLKFPDISPELWECVVKYLDPVHARSLSIEMAMKLAPVYDQYSFDRGLKLCNQVLSDFFQRNGEWGSELPKDALNLLNEKLELFERVARGLDRSQVVEFKNAVASLQTVNRYLENLESARTFMEGYMIKIIDILVQQQPRRIGQAERYCVKESLEIAVKIVAKDLPIQLLQKTNTNGECKVLNVLASVFDKTKNFYQTTYDGLPTVRKRLIDNFFLERGFSYLGDYLSARRQTPQFPSLEFVHHMLVAMNDILVDKSFVNSDVVIKKDVIQVSKAALEFISCCTEERLQSLPHDALNTVRDDLEMIFDSMEGKEYDSHGFYESWQAFTLKLITFESLALKLLGWDQVSFLVESWTKKRPPIRELHENQLVKWALENGLVDLVFGSSVQSEIVARAIPLIKFLACRYERDAPIQVLEERDMQHNACYLEEAHLLLAWQTCTSSTDSAMKIAHCRLLVSILSSLTSEMAVALLSAVQMSLKRDSDSLFEVAEFCSMLTSSDTGEALGLQGVSEDVQKEVLRLIRSLLARPGATLLTRYDELKRYITTEPSL